MNIYFSGIGGVGIGPLAEVARDAGHTVQGSDSDETPTAKQLRASGISVNIGQNGQFLQERHSRQPIDWLIYTSALPADHAELTLAKKLGIKIAKRSELLKHIVAEKNLKLIAVSGSHGKTTTTAMLIWTMQQLNVPVSYLVGAALPFGASGHYAPGSQYFIYECDEYDRNFLQYHPQLSLITSVGYDHPDTYPTETDYIEAFQQFIAQSGHLIMWQADNKLLDATATDGWILSPDDLLSSITLPGSHNRRNATLAAKAIEYLQLGSLAQAASALNLFPGTSRRFERLAPGIYTDYAHHPTEIAATLQLARELNNHIVVVYQPHQNTRQHTVRSQYASAFQLANEIYWLPTYLSREDASLDTLQPNDFIESLAHPAAYPADLNDDLWQNIQTAQHQGKLVVFMGAGTIDEWIRRQVATLSQN